MVFEYANRFVQRGHEVTIVFNNVNAYKKYHLPRQLRYLLVRFMTACEPKWFELDGKVRKLSSTDNRLEKSLGEVDVCIATAAITVDYAKTLKSKKYAYFIQGYEDWDLPEEYLINTYQGGMKNIVVAEWLKNKVAPYCNTCISVIKNPIDINQYRQINTPGDRKDHSIGLLYHTSEKKGYRYAFEVLLGLKMRYPDLTVEMFGAFDPPDNLPQWIHYTKNATINETVKIYNSVSVFLCASIEEGYGLTGLEAMACGAALVSSCYLGVREYAVDGYNALLAPIRDSAALIELVSQVFDNPLIRSRIVCNGIRSVNEFSWDKATTTFLNVLQETMASSFYS